MIHDFEEIIMGRPWLRRESYRLRQYIPAKAHSILFHMENLSTSAFALAVAEEFCLIAAFTWICVEGMYYSAWAGVLLAFFLHLIVHLFQAIYVWGYIPAIVTAIPAGIYCVCAFLFLSRTGLLDWSAVFLWTIASAIFFIINLACALRLAGAFDTWLQRQYA
jgi:hypothetical protein